VAITNGSSPVETPATVQQVREPSTQFTISSRLQHVVTISFHLVTAATLVRHLLMNSVSGLSLTPPPPDTASGSVLAANRLTNNKQYWKKAQLHVTSINPNNYKPAKHSTNVLSPLTTLGQERGGLKIDILC